MLIQYCCNCHYYKYIFVFFLNRPINRYRLFWSSNYRYRYRRWKILIGRPLLHMPLPNVNMPCLLLFWLMIIVLFHCWAPSPAQYALDSPFVQPPTYAVTSPGSTVASRDKTSLIITQCLGLTSNVLTSYHTLVCTSIFPWPEICSFYSLFWTHWLSSAFSTESKKEQRLGIEWWWERFCL